MAAAPKAQGRQKRRLAADVVIGDAPALFGATRMQIITLHELLRVSSLGLLSSAAVQRRGRHAFADQCKLLTSLGLSTDHAFEEPKNIARLATWGEHAGHINEALLALLGAPLAVPGSIEDIHCVSRQQKIGRPHVVASTPFPICYPHAVFAH